jgi:hypothetical protein
MFRIAILAAAVAALAPAGCSKSAGTKDTPNVADPGPGPAAAGGGEVIAPPTPAGAGAPAQNNDAFKLKPEEGRLSIEVPPDAVAGQETIARVIVTPSEKFKINFEFATKLTLEPPAEVTAAKTELKAGGQAQAKGDAEKFEEKGLAFAVKLTPTKSGTHTVKGSFKFAVCDKDQCLAKKEPIEIQLAAK